MKDYFEFYEEAPKEIIQMFDGVDEISDQFEDLLNKCNARGWTFEYDMSGASNLRPMTPEELVNQFSWDDYTDTEENRAIMDLTNAAKWANGQHDQVFKGMSPAEIVFLYLAKKIEVLHNLSIPSDLEV